MGNAFERNITRTEAMDAAGFTGLLCSRAAALLTLHIRARIIAKLDSQGRNVRASI
jgi:hypothetical protein